MGLEEEDFTVFTWKLSDYRNAQRKTLSPEFSCGGHKWSVSRILRVLELKARTWARGVAKVRHRERARAPGAW